MSQSALARDELVTAEQLLHMQGDDLRRELIRGEVRTMSPAGHNHGWIAGKIFVSLAQVVYARGLGRAYTAETGFRIESDPDTVRAPDAAFVRQERVDAVTRTRGFFPGAPDLAVEVVSPDDAYAYVEEKVLEWLASGCRMVIVVNPEKRRVAVHTSPREVMLLSEGDTIEGGDVVPGWQLPVREIFE